MRESWILYSSDRDVLPGRGHGPYPMEWNEISDVGSPVDGRFDGLISRRREL